MSSSQHRGEQGSFFVPQLVVYDYDYGSAEEDYSLPELPQYSKSSLLVQSKKTKAKYKDYSGSDTETEPSSKMSSLSSKNSSKKDKSSGKSKQRKSDDWTDVTEPEERRRIQNRIAQRKFREKAREERERAHREAQNEKLAGACYEIPAPSSLGTNADLSGLPWGGVNTDFAMIKGHHHASQQSSHHVSDSKVDPQLLSPYSAGDYTQVSSFDGRDSSGDDQTYYPDNSSYGYYEFDGHSGDGSHTM